MTVSSLACWAGMQCSVDSLAVLASRYVFEKDWEKLGSNNFLFQIVIYIFARVMLALAKMAIQPNMHPLSSIITPEARDKMTNNAYPVFASVTWAMVMYIWRWYPETLASSLRSSMVYMYVVLEVIWGYPADIDLVMATRIIGIPCARFCCITNEGVLFFFSAYRAVMIGVFQIRCASFQAQLVFGLHCIMRYGLLYLLFYYNIYTQTILSRVGQKHSH